MNKKEVFFDIETKKLFDEISGFDPADLEVSIVSVYERVIDENLNEIEGRIISFWENELNQMWSIFEGADRIIGFNSLGFDVPALKKLAPSHFAKLPHFDIMQKFKNVANHRIGLNALAKETLGKAKTDSGINATKYWAMGDPDSLAKLKKYCEADVIITKELYDYILKNRKVKFLDKWNTLREIELDFSYPKEDTPQIGLF